MSTFPEVGVMPYRDFPATYNELTRIPTITGFFRRSAQLETVLPLAIGEARDEPYTVLSIGSSYGAEADSVLTYATQIAQTKVNLVGIDPNPEAIVRARDAKYVVVTKNVLTNHETTSEAELKDAFPLFDVSTQTEHWMGQVEHSLVVDTSSLRQLHDVEFLRGDITSNEMSIPEADLILCNNLLLHLSSQPAATLLNRMVDYLKPGGLMSLDSMASDMLAGYTDCFVWDEIPQLDFAAKDVRPAAYKIDGRVPFVFQRAA